MDGQMIIIINLFFVPTISLWIGYKRGLADIMPSLQYLYCYCAAVICNVILTKIAVIVGGKLFGLQNMNVDSVNYTYIAMTAAALMPRLYIAGKRIMMYAGSLPGRMKKMRQRPRGTD